MRMAERHDKLIEAVKKRPLLYSRYHPQFTDRTLKKELWNQVCADVTPNWNELTRGQKGEMLLEIQRRWKTLRDGFSRELSFQRLDRMKRANGEYVKRRKIYTHYNELKFLLKQKKKPVDDDAQEEEGNENENSDGTEEDGADDSDNMAHSFKIEPGTSSYYVDVGTVQDTKGFGDQNITGFDSSNNVSLGLDLEKTANDDDKLFCLSLVPSFKKMTEKQKYDARIRIMQVLSEIRFKDSETLNSDTTVIQE